MEMKASERQNRILDMLQANGRVDIAQLSEDLGVSTVTIRADLNRLENAQLLRRVRGGAVAAFTGRYDASADVLTPPNLRQKERIVTEALKLVFNGQTIFLSSGTTAELLAARIPATITDLVVATNSINVARILADHPGVSVIVTGGTLRSKVNSLVAPLGDVLLREINADLGLLSASGVDVDRGFTNASWAEAEVAKAMVRAAKRVVFLADHSKIGHIASARIVGLGEANGLITDSGAPSDFLRGAREKGLDIITA
ncbi:MAG: DeoR/GlpR transcriptional regulator [Roseibium sp.]|nr:DeoR/GlpR transcriptional regulator [Roseibium sp.]